jgi:hypothetical protein
MTYNTKYLAKILQKLLFHLVEQQVYSQHLHHLVLVVDFSAQALQYFLHLYRLPQQLIYFIQQGEEEEDDIRLQQLFRQLILMMFKNN